MTRGYQLEPPRPLRKLREGTKDYFRAYYAEVRRLIEAHDSHEGVTAPYQGCKRVLATLGADGIIITHWDTLEDSFEFEISTESAEEIIAGQTGTPSGGPDLGRVPPEVWRGCEVISTGDGFGLRILHHTVGRDFGAGTIQEPVKVPSKDGPCGSPAGSDSTPRAPTTFTPGRMRSG